GIVNMADASASRVLFNAGHVRWPNNMPAFVMTSDWDGTVSADGNFLAVNGDVRLSHGGYGNRGRVISVWNLRTGAQTIFHPAPGGDASWLVMSQLQITPDGSKLVSVDNLGYLHVYDLP